MPEIDLSQLPPPNVVERLDFETILAEIVADYRSRYPQFTAYVESEPALKLLETSAYREFLLRWRINEAAKAVMVAFARAADLEQLTALFGVERGAGEGDARLRRRQQLSLDRLSVAGSRGAYEFHILTADPRVGTPTISTPTPGTVRAVVIGGEEEGALPSAELVAIVVAALSSETVRPLTDTVEVLAARHIVYQLSVTLHVEQGPDREVVRQAAEAAVLAYLRSGYRAGGIVYKSAILAAAHVAGVTHVEAAFSWEPGIAYAADKLDITDAAFNALPDEWTLAAAFWPSVVASIDGASTDLGSSITGYQYPATAPLDGVSVVIA